MPLLPEQRKKRFDWLHAWRFDYPTLGLNFGLMKGEIRIADGFDSPLPDACLDNFWTKIVFQPDAAFPRNHR